MDQTWDNGKLTNFRSDFCLFSKFGILGNVASYHFMQFQEILINQIEKMTKKNLVSDPTLANLVQIRAT